MSFTGKYELTDSKNFDEYLKEIGVGFMTRKVATNMKPSVHIDDNGQTVKIKTLSALKTTEITYPLGQEVDEETADGRKGKSTMVRDGNSLKTVLKLDGHESEIIRTLTDNGFDAIFKAGSVVCTRSYKKVE